MVLVTQKIRKKIQNNFFLAVYPVTKTLFLDPQKKIIKLPAVYCTRCYHRKKHRLHRVLNTGSSGSLIKQVRSLIDL